MSVNIPKKLCNTLRKTEQVVGGGKDHSAVEAVSDMFELVD
jgi:hypothetical protein